MAERTRGSSKRNRSLLRCAAVLRAFRPGSERLGNSEIVERTGLSPATVTRLTKTLVDVGYLEYDGRFREYRLGAGVLSLGHALRTGSSLLRVATPLMMSLARKLRVNVGLAVEDADEMVYLESCRFNAQASQRLIVSGHRVPIEVTALGRSYLAVCPERDRTAALSRLKAKGLKRWAAIEREVSAAIADVKKKGYCWASWQPRVIAVATPLSLPGRPVHILNISVTSAETITKAVERLHGPLMELSAQITAAVSEDEAV